MDQFYLNVDTEIFYKWILSKDYQHITMNKTPDGLTLENDYGIATINFYESSIIEFRVENKSNKESVFFIHFEMNNFKHATGLYEEMIECLENLQEKKGYKVLLSCTSGFTTGYFAEKLNSAAELLELEYTFDAVPFSELYEKGNESDVILLAPQVSYQLTQVEKNLKDKLVLAIPPKLFGKYDVNNTLDFLEKELEKLEWKKMTEDSPLPIKRFTFQKHGMMLCIAYIIYGSQLRFIGRLYNEDDILMEDYEFLKDNLDVEDICHMIDVINEKYEDLEIISISLPGLIKNGIVHNKRYGLMNYDLKTHLLKKYKKHIIISNDTNATVMGLYASQEEYDSVSFLFQGRIGGKGGVGHIHNGHLIKGRHNFAGAISFLPMKLSEAYEEIKNTEAGIQEWFKMYCLAIICMIDPECIFISSSSVLDLDELKESLKEYVSEKYIPEIVQIQGLKEYILLGSIILALKEIENSKKR